MLSLFCPDKTKICLLLVCLLYIPAVTTAQDVATTTADTLSPDYRLRAAAFTALGRDRLVAYNAQGAAQALGRALQDNPGHAPAYYYLGLALKAGGNATLSKRVLETYIRLGTDSLRVQRAQAFIAASGHEHPLSPIQTREQSGYIGPQACAACHTEKFDGFNQTAHARTSHLATPNNVNGTFSGDEATLWTRNRDLWFEMSQRPEGLFQTANTWAGGDLKERRERFDLVIGSGKIGQSYLYWRGDRLYQLPVSHYSANDAWVNSPGFRDGEAFFERPIIPRCLECHSTYFQSNDHKKNIHGRTEAILGVTCERCHGPGAAHARLQHEANGAPAATDTIVHPGLLTRQQQLDLCGQCHSDTGPPQQTPFAFRPGDTLQAHYAEKAAAETESGGVHAANQVGRLAASACFRSSPSMSCITCHDPHNSERGDTALFSQRCLECHTVDICDMSPRLGQTIAANCIDCHMPRRRDVHTQVQSADDLQSPLMPDHHIGIYPEATRIFLEKISKRK
jgi:hypothetical protein